jgi:hypothetical protein
MTIYRLQKEIRIKYEYFNLRAAMNMGVLMTYAKTIFVRKTAALSLPLLGYLIASVFQVQLWGNILSPINALASSGILLFAYLRSAKGNFARFSLLLYSIAAMVWGVGDIAWAVMDSYGNDPYPPKDTKF